MTIVYVVLGVLVLLVLGYILINNSLISARNKCDEAWSGIDVQLKRRHDLIPNLVEVVKDYMSYEQETLRQVIEARNGAVKASTGGSPAAAMQAENALTGALGRFFALAENYPQLKADQNVARLMEELSGTENKISFARQFYNDSVMSLNNAVQGFPTNLIANMFGFNIATYFEVPEAEKATPKVDLR